MRFIITGRRKDHPWCYYVTTNGCISTTGASAAVVVGLAEAKRELSYWQRETQGYRWSLERLPPRMKLENAILHAETVDA